jgi:hypothetical protein
VAVGVNKITFVAGELTTGAIVAASATGLTVKTSVDAVSAGASVPALAGPTVQSASITLAAADQKALQATTAVTTVTFTTETSIPAAGTITITLPANYFSAKASPAAVHVPASGTAATLSCALTAATLTIVCTTSVNAVAVGVNKITFVAGELTTGAIVAASATGLTVKTSVDLVSAGASVPALAGPTVQSASITLAPADQKALQATTAVTTVTFTTVTSIPAAGTITITLPANYFSGKASPAAVHVPASGTAATLSCALTANTLTIVCTTSVIAVAVGVNKITFAAGELTTGAIVAASATGLTVKTSVDLVSAGASVPALAGPTVQSASITLDAADQKPTQATTAVTTVTFTTETSIPAAGTITITLPANYFSGKATPAAVHVPASGTAATLSCALTANTLTIVCTTSVNAVAVGINKITFVAGELTTGAAVAASATGLTVKTSVDLVSAGALVPALSTPAGPAATTKASASSVASSAALLVAAIIVGVLL